VTTVVPSVTLIARWLLVWSWGDLNCKVAMVVPRVTLIARCQCCF